MEKDHYLLLISLFYILCLDRFLGLVTCVNRLKSYSATLDNIFNYLRVE